jgi:hypothetical protein
MTALIVCFILKEGSLTRLVNTMEVNYMKKYTYGLILLYLSMLMMFSIGCGSSGGGGITPVVNPTPNTTANPTPINPNPSTQTTLISIVDSTGVNYDADPKSSKVTFTLKGTNFSINNTPLSVLFINVATGETFSGVITAYTMETINGYVTLPAGKYLVRVTNNTGYTVQQVYFYKGVGSYEVTVK